MSYKEKLVFLIGKAWGIKKTGLSVIAKKSGKITVQMKRKQK